jgi:hypothetical protein
MILRCLRSHQLEMDVCRVHYLSVLVSLSTLQIRCRYCLPSLRPLRLAGERSPEVEVEVEVEVEEC